MIDEYLTYWGLQKTPFSLTPDPDMLYLSGQHRECLLRLKYAIKSNKGGALLVSDHAGDGKTTILTRLCREMEAEYGEKVNLVFIDHPTLTPIQMINEISRQLGITKESRDKVHALNQLRDQLLALHENRHKTVVIVDEGHMLSHRLDLLQELRILLNFCVADAFLLTFIFSGQKPLEGIVRNMPEFWQRLPVRFFLKNLNLHETKELIRFRLAQAGSSGGDIFTDYAYDTIYKASNGVPRVICSVADLCLVIGHSHGVKRIDFAQVSLACKDMEGTGEGFHYFHFLEKGKKESKSEKVSRESNHVPTTTCPHCQAAVDERKKICQACHKPLVVKCPRCETLNWIQLVTCKKCGCEMGQEEMRREQNLTARIRELGITRKQEDEHWASLAADCDLPATAKVLMAFPRGTLFRSGPTITQTPRDGKTATGKGTVVLTNEDLILRFRKQTVSLPHFEIKTVPNSNPEKQSDTDERAITVEITDTRYVVQFPAHKTATKRLTGLLSSYLIHKSLK